jgi:glycerate kinase
VRALLAFDCFGNELSAVAVGSMVADGWSQGAPRDRFEFAPMSDGGPGFVSVLGNCNPHEWRYHVDEQIAMHGSDVYVESARVVGLDLDQLDPGRSSRAFGELLMRALAHEPRRVFVGLGGTGVMDGGAGAQEVLAHWPSEVELIACTDVLVPLLGPTGAVYGFGPQKGATPEELPVFEDRMRVRAD